MAFRGLTFHRIRTRDPQVRRHLRDLSAGLAPIAIVLSLVLLLRLEVAASVAMVVLGLVFLYRYTPVRLLRLTRKAVS